MADLSWKVLRTSWDEDTGAVVSAMWLLIAKDSGYESYVKGETQFSPNPESENYIPLKDLTEEDVVSWIKNNVKNKEGLEKLALERLEKKKVPSTVRGLPWEVS